MTSAADAGRPEPTPQAPLTRRQAEVLAHMRAHRLRHGSSPTIRELARLAGIRSTNGVVDHLKALKRKGMLEQEASKSRGWRPRVLDPPAGAPGAPGGRATISVPLLGTVAAGQPIVAIEQHGPLLTIDPQLLARNGRELFALTVVGDSMVDAGIIAQDTIVVERRETADPGAIVVVMIGEETTVKRFVPLADRRSVRLEPANPTLRPTTLRGQELAELRIIGVVVAVWRRL